MRVWDKSLQDPGVQTRRVQEKRAYGGVFISSLLRLRRVIYGRINLLLQFQKRYKMKICPSIDEEVCKAGSASSNEVNLGISENVSIVILVANGNGIGV